MQKGKQQMKDKKNVTDLPFLHAAQCSSLHIQQQLTPAAVDKAAQLFVGVALSGTSVCANVHSWPSQQV